MEQTFSRSELADAAVRFVILILCFLFGFFLNSLES